MNKVNNTLKGLFLEQFRFILHYFENNEEVAILINTPQQFNSCVNRCLSEDYIQNIYYYKTPPCKGHEEEPSNLVFSFIEFIKKRFYSLAINF